jgi:hypothetical protein
MRTPIYFAASFDTEIVNVTGCRPADGQVSKECPLKQIHHIVYIRTNNPRSAYAVHVLNDRHQHGPIFSAVDHLQPCKKGPRLDSWENYCM